MAATYHEPPEELSAGTRDLHRALSSLMEEFEAIDWYQHRIDVSPDADLRAILTHNRNEEMEHAAMALEWLRRRVPELDRALRTYLFTTGNVTEIEEQVEQGGPAAEAGKITDDGSLGIGKMTLRSTK